MLTKEQLDAIKARDAKATAGEWKYNRSAGFYSVFEADTVVRGWKQAELVVSESDAEFIAHARQDVPVLVAEVERLTALIGVVYTEDAPEHLKEFIADKMGWCNE